MIFIKDMGYHMGIIYRDEAFWKRSKCLIDTLLLMDARTKEDREIIFCMSQMPLSFSLHSHLYECAYFVTDCLHIR